MNKSLGLTKKKLISKRLSFGVSLGAYMLVLPALLVACGKSEWREVKAPNTGDVAAEVKTGDIPAGTAQPDQPAYVVPDRLRARTTPDQDPETSTTLLERNDPVHIVDPTPIGDEQLVAIRYGEPVQPRVADPAPVAAPRSKAPPASVVATAPKKTPVYVPLKYLKKNPVETSVSDSEADRYIMIQNIATEKLRVYERSTVAGEPNRLVFESDMIAGENDPAKTRRTAVGSYKIEKWVKFYQDIQGLFPSWQDPKLASLPLPGAELEDWTRPYLMPVVNGKPSGQVRGAFGWYTAKIGPNAHAQWTHGTLGWGADHDRFIKIPKTQLAQFYSDPRSFGCSRVENRAIAYLQDLLPAGTRVLKVYARETIADKNLSRYQNVNGQKFDWILTSDEVRKEKPNTSSKPQQLLRAVPQESVIEEGTYEIDAKPDAVPFKKTVKGDKLEATLIRPEANLYDLPETSFHGVFLVDEGRFVQYKHPRELRSGGYSDNLLPGAVIKK